MLERSSPDLFAAHPNLTRLLGMRLVEEIHAFRANSTLVSRERLEEESEREVRDVAWIFPRFSRANELRVSCEKYRRSHERALSWGCGGEVRRPFPRELGASPAPAPPSCSRVRVFLASGSSSFLERAFGGHGKRDREMPRARDMTSSVGKPLREPFLTIYDAFRTQAR